MNSVFIGIDLSSRAKDWSSLPFAFEQGNFIETICYCKFKV